MSSKPLYLNVRPRGTKLKNLPDETYVTPQDNGHDLYLRIAAKSRCDINQLRITKASDGTVVPNTKDISIEDLGLYEQSTIFVKDLGPQIAWRTVFILEYLGPLLFHLLFYYGRSYIYERPSTLASFPAASLSQQLSFYFIMIHFLKREYETLFVHRFSAATMPVSNIYKNCGHYWALAGLNIALCTYSPAPACPTAQPSPDWLIITAIVLFVVGELGNLSAHLTLRDLRKQGTTQRGIPRGGVFNIVPVTCPNYFFETVAWLGVWAANRSWSTVIFAVVAVVQMAIWARKKERRYRKEFGVTYKKKRFSMLPGII